MQQSLEKRVSALEKSAPQADKVIFIILVGMGEVGMEITHIRDNHGNQWNRRPEETEEAFKDRAKSETPRKDNQAVMLFGEIAHMGHWRDTVGQTVGTIQNN
ncbi:hypothetical protein [Rhodoferax aquaticus]|uniref:Uncharacterized protein n=1 Tax=Rhodoferax aquaticus TaxID=2527691 RepID=A0A515ELN0_9BURK|nr:hypothetical protein [Rhodoferax aquaticus]QDL53573.1 hypothetical protein EXZ61_04930 [Rhodoferax aquaticus]